MHVGVVVRIVTDAVADLPLWLAERVGVVPLRVTIRDKTYSSSELSPEKVHELLRELRPGEMNTSQPSPKDFAAIFKTVKEPIVYIAASSLLSGTINSARSAVRILGREDIFVVDSLSASVGQGLLTYYALTLADRGMDAEEIAARIEEKRSDVRVYLCVGSLDYLRATGRIGKAVHFFGKMFDLVPILSLRQGRIHVDGVVRNVGTIRELARRMDTGYLWIGHICAQEKARKLANKVRGKYEILFDGPVISIHVGPGSFGGGFIRGFNPSR